jgi:glycosyltransferase involved in cell wall biosynthesis
MRRAALICAYNEEQTAAAVIAATLRYVDLVIFVNDGSTDRTLETVQRRFGRNPQVKIITWGRNRGKGAALLAGFRYFLRRRIPLLVTLDADGQHDPTQIPLLLLLLERKAVDMVIGSRYGKVERHVPIMRAVFNIFASFIMLLTTGAFFADVASGYRAYTRAAIKAMVPKLSLAGYGIELEILRAATMVKLRLATLPVRCIYLGRKANLPALAVDYFRFALKYKCDICKRLLRLR